VPDDSARDCTDTGATDRAANRSRVGTVMPTGAASDCVADAGAYQRANSCARDGASTELTRLFQPGASRGKYRQAGRASQQT